MRRGKTDIQTDFSIADGAKIDSIDITLIGSDTSIPTGKAVKDITDTNNAKILTNQDNISLNAFRTAINGSLSLFGMVDGKVDEYEDENGIDFLNAFSHMALENNTDDGTGANTVTDIGTPTYTSGKLNNALTLDGSTDALNLDALMTDIKTDTTGSIAIWFNTDLLTGNRNIFALGDSGANTHFRILKDPSGKILCGLTITGTDAWQLESSAITASVWHHIVIVQDGVSPKMYLNGVDVTNLTSSSDTTKWFLSTATWNLGRIGCANFDSLGNLQFWDGKIDDFRYYQNKVLTTSAISTIYNSGAGTESSINENSTNISYDSVNDLYSPTAPGDLKLLLNFDGTDGATSTTDESDSSHVITFNGDAQLDTAIKKFGTASLLLDGTGDYLTIPDSSDWDVGSSLIGDYTIDLWTKTTDQAGQIIAQMEDGSNNWRFLLQSNRRLRFLFRITGTDNIDLGNISDIYPDDNAWHHIAVIKIDDEWGLYIDGTQVDFDTQTLTDTFSGVLGIGINTFDSSSPYNGSMDSIRITQSNVFSASPNVGLSDTITIPTSAPANLINNMTLVSISFPAQAEADNARIVLFEEDVDSITLNTDLKAFVSRDDGTTFTQITLENQGEYESGRNIISASVDISSQPTGTDMIYKIETLNNKDLKIHGTSLSWD